VAPAGRWAVLYDGPCGFCAWCVGVLLAWDRRGRLRPVPIDSPEGRSLLDPVPPAARPVSWHLVGPDGRVLSAGAAVGPVLRLLPGGRPLAALADAAPGLTERAYRGVVRHRGTLGRLVPARSRARARRRIAARARGSAGGCGRTPVAYTSRDPGD
jgi:predicted DCC family thiol-disulfide oxidoreductase YuxK